MKSLRSHPDTNKFDIDVSRIVTIKQTNEIKMDT